MVMDSLKRLWLTYNKGIVMFDPSADSIRTFNQDDGLPALQFTEPVHQFEDGEIWFTSYDGITSFYPGHIHDLNIPAIPQITDIQVNDKLPQEKLICDISGTSNVPLMQKLSFKYKKQYALLPCMCTGVQFSTPYKSEISNGKPG
jgi:hypothetical protein